MANGEGYKLWQDETVEAEEMQGFLQRQVVASFVDTSARDTAITAVPEGMLTVDRQNNVVHIGEQGDDWVEFARYGEWEEYVPALTATSVNPTIGTGPVQEGRVIRQGTRATVHLNIEFGTSMAAGTGIYEVALPTTSPAASGLHTAVEQIVGHGVARLAGVVTAVAARVVSAGTIRFEYHGGTGDMDEASPGVWADSDTVFCGTLDYETAPGSAP